MSGQTITVGYWETRDGRKARVLCTDAPGEFPIKGYVIDSASFGWPEGGLRQHQSESDLIRPWVDRPVVDWGKEREWVEAVALDADGSWYRFSSTPTILGELWSGEHKSFAQRMHPSEYPQFTGSWKDSLCLRPEGGSK